MYFIPNFQSFIVRQILQQESLKAQGIASAKFLPKSVTDSHKGIAKIKFRNMSYTGGKDLPLHQRLDKFKLKKRLDSDSASLSSKEDDLSTITELTDDMGDCEATVNKPQTDTLPMVKGSSMLASQQNHTINTVKQLNTLSYSNGLPRITPVKRSVTFINGQRQKRSHKRTLPAYKSFPEVSSQGGNVSIPPLFLRERTAPEFGGDDFRVRSVLDTRFKDLEESLSNCYLEDELHDGYVMLSPSSWRKSHTDHEDGGREDEVKVQK